MSTIKTTWIGGTSVKLPQEIAHLGRAFSRQITDAVRATVGDSLVREISRAAPKSKNAPRNMRTGLTRQAGGLKASFSHRVRKDGNKVTIQILTDSPYFKHVTEGTVGPYVIEAKYSPKQWLRYVKEGEGIKYRKWTVHPGIQTPNPFHERAIAKATPRIERRLNEVIRSALRNARGS